MLSFFGAPERYCDGIHRRQFFQVGALGLGGLSLGQLMQLRAEQPSESSPKSVIFFYMGGGPSHIDMYDLKPEAPAEFRGEFKPIQTNVPGMDICELMPLQAKIADKFAILRGLQTSEPHGPHELMSGFSQRGAPGVIRPAFGAVVSKVRTESGSVKGALPPYVSFMYDAEKLSVYEDPSYLGPAHRPFSPTDQGARNLRSTAGMTGDRLQDRKALLQSFDGLRRDLDGRAEMGAVDAFQARALDMITSPKARAAFDLSQESAQVRDRYGKAGAEALQARRLVEAGVSVVTLRLGSQNWDTHQANFKTLRVLIPEVDRTIHALVTDLHERGLDKDVLVVACGEFGRTPRIGDTTPDGRGHHTPCGFVLFAGGGLRMGQVVGESDNRAARSKGKPFRMQNVLATVYRVLGIDPAKTFKDATGRPQFLLDDHEKINPLL